MTLQQGPEGGARSRKTGAFQNEETRTRRGSRGTRAWRDDGMKGWRGDSGLQAEDRGPGGPERPRAWPRSLPPCGKAPGRCDRCPDGAAGALMDRGFLDVRPTQTPLWSEVLPARRVGGTRATEAPKLQAASCFRTQVGRRGVWSSGASHPAPRLRPRASLPHRLVHEALKRFVTPESVKGLTVCSPGPCVLGGNAAHTVNLFYGNKKGPKRPRMISKGPISPVQCPRSPGT